MIKSSWTPRLSVFLLFLTAIAAVAPGNAWAQAEPAVGVVPLATTVRDMSPSELADIRAMRAETLPDAPYMLDMTNPLHYRYVMAALARAGETPAKSPEFFRRLNRAHTMKLAANARPRAAQLALTSTEGPSNLNFISTFSVDATANYQATGLSSVVGGTDVTTIIMELYNVQTGKVFAVKQDSTTQYAQGTDFKVKASGQSPQGVTDTTTEASGVFTYLPLNSTQPVVVYYRSEDTINPSTPCMSKPNYCMRDTAKNCIPGQYQTTCTNTVTNTTPILSCWWRGSQAECDYWNNNNHPADFVFPIQGNVSYPNNTVVTPLTGFIYIALQNPLQGGGCNVFFQKAGALDPTYWTLSGTTVSWNFPAAAFPNKGDCINYYDNTSTFLWMNGNVLLQGSPNQPPPYGAINFTSDPAQRGIKGVSIIPGMLIQQGCFAAGTQIRQADGTPRNIEDFTGQNESVMTGQGAPLMVSGITKGIEPLKKMVRIKTSRGQQILVTEGHPIISASGEPILAKDFKVGQPVKTHDGDAKVTSVTREAYAGKVYNLRLGDPVTADEHGATEHGATMYAGGILTGDSRMQNYYARLEKEKLARDPGEVLKRLPPAWVQDFKNHQ
jgi:hypothetical protein